MKPTQEQVEQIQTLLINEGAAVSFRKRETKETDGYWYLTRSGVDEAGKEVPDKYGTYNGDREFYRSRPIHSFLDFAQTNDLIATVNLDGASGSDEEFEDWEHLARYMGITDLVVLSTKVPKKVAQKFQFYTTKSTTISDKLRSLVYDYVIEEMKNHAEEDMFR